MEAQPPEKKTEEKNPAPAGGRKSCLKIFLAAAAVLLFIFLLVSGAIALAVAATGLVKIPLLSNLIKPPTVTEDFSYTKVSEKQLENKLRTIEESGDKVNATLTDDEVNTLIADLVASPDSAVKNILVKFRPGVVKVSGTLSQNDAPLYLEIKLSKSATAAEFEIQNARLGALPLPGFLVEGIIGQLLGGTGELLGPPDISSWPVDEITVKDGSIVIKGLDLSGLGPPEE